MIAFGSRGRGEARSDSDLDLAVICAETSLTPQQKRERRRLCREALGLLGRDVDLVVVGASDAALLLAIVRRRLNALELSLDSPFPKEDWGFTAERAVEKILKAWIVLADARPPPRHDLAELTALAGSFSGNGSAGAADLRGGSPL